MQIALGGTRHVREVCVDVVTLLLEHYFKPMCQGGEMALESCVLNASCMLLTLVIHHST